MIGDLIGEWIKGILIDGIMGNLSGLFNTVNTKVGEMCIRDSVMGSLFADPSIGDHQNLICLTDGIQAVCNHKPCFTLYQFIDCLLDIAFNIGINTRCV